MDLALRLRASTISHKRPTIAKTQTMRPITFNSVILGTSGGLCAESRFCTTPSRLRRSYRQDLYAPGELTLGSGRGRVSGLELLPDDVDLSFIARDAFADADSKLVEFRDVIFQAFEASGLIIKALVYGVEALIDVLVLGIEALVHLNSDVVQAVIHVVESVVD